MVAVFWLCYLDTLEAPNKCNSDAVLGPRAKMLCTKCYDTAAAQYSTSSESPTKLQKTDIDETVTKLINFINSGEVNEEQLSKIYQ